MDHTPTPDTPTATRPRWLIAAAMSLVLVVVLAAFALSFTVLRDLAAMSGIPGDFAWLWPLIVDGTIAAATLVFYTSSGRGRRLAMATLILFGIASIVGNVSHILLVAPSQVIPVAIAVFVGVMPPVGLIMTVELLGSLLRLHRGTATDAVHSIVDAVDQQQVTTGPQPAHDDEPTVSRGAEPSEPRMAHTDEPMDHLSPGLAHEPEPAHRVKEEGQVNIEPREPRVAHEPADERLASVTQDRLTDPLAATVALSEPAPIMSLVTATALGQDDELTPEPSMGSYGEPEPRDPEPMDHVSCELAHEPEPVDFDEPSPEPGELALETTEGQVAWIAAQAQEGEPVTASVLVDRFAEVGIEMSLSTVKRRLAAARKEQPEAFEEAS